MNKIICRIIKNFLMNKDPYCFQHNKLCNCSLPFCHVKFKESDKYFPKNYTEFKKCISINNGKSRRNS